MGNIFSSDFRDFIGALNNQQVEYILVGGLSVYAHGYGRTTGDMDIWTNQTEDNYVKLSSAFQEFGMPVFDMTLEAYLSADKDVFSFGRSPQKIEILTQVKGLVFEQAYPSSEFREIEGVMLRLIGRDDLIKAKEAVNRLKDQLDVQMLKKIWAKKK